MCDQVNLNRMIDEESDLFEHELYVIQVFEEGNPNDDCPEFFRFHKFFNDLEAIQEQGYVVEPLFRIHKTTVLSRAFLYAQESYAKEEMSKLYMMRIGTKIRKVDIRLKPEDKDENLILNPVEI